MSNWVNGDFTAGDLTHGDLVETSGAVIENGQSVSDTECLSRCNKLESCMYVTIEITTGKDKMRKCWLKGQSNDEIRALTKT